MAISLQCTGCGKQYRLREELAGKRVQCGCGESMTIPFAAVDPGDEPDDDPGDDLLDESIWEPPIRSAPVEDAAPAKGVVSTEDAARAKPEGNVLESPSVGRSAPRAVTGESAPGASLPEAESETTSETVGGTSPAEGTRRRITVSRRTLAVNLAIGYGAVMTAYLVITLLVLGFGYYRLGHVALTAAIAAGGVLLRKGHAKGSTVIGLACAGVFVVSGVWDLVAFLSNLAAFFSAILVDPLAGETGAALLSCTILLVKAALVYPIPIYLIRWSLKEEGKAQEREERDDFYVIRDRISEKMAEQRQRERQGR